MKKYIAWIFVSALGMGISLDLDVSWSLFIPSMVSLIISLAMGIDYLSRKS